MSEPWVGGNYICEDATMFNIVSVVREECEATVNRPLIVIIIVNTVRIFVLGFHNGLALSIKLCVSYYYYYYFNNVLEFQLILSQ